MERRHLSIVTTLYNSRPFLRQFIDDCLEALREIGCDDFELLFVNDGSPDDSLEFLRAEQEKNSSIVIVDLSRNFGHHYAAHAGLSHATGYYVFLIDCDLEVSPQVLVKFYRDLTDGDYDVVYGYQEKRIGGPIKRVGGRVFWRLFNWLSDTRVPPNIVTERLMTRRYVDAFLDLGDRNLFLVGMMHWVGFHQVGRPVEKKQRPGKDSYTLRRRIRLLVEALSSFSAVPLRMLFTMGILITAISAVAGTVLLVDKLLDPDAVLLGWTSIVVLNLTAIGLNLSAIGLVGIYLSKMFRQTQNRPLFVVRDIYRSERD